MKPLIRHGYGFKAQLSFWRFVRYLKGLRFDLAHIHGYPPLLRVGLACIVAGKPFVVQYHSYHDAKGKFLWNFIEKVVLKKAEAIVCVSNAVRESVVRRSFMDYHDKFRVIINCSDMSSNPQKVDECSVVWTGRFSSQKRPLDFVRFVESLSGVLSCVRGIMVGAGDWFESVEKEVKEKVLPVKLTGFVSDVSNYITKSYIAVSTSEREGISLSVIEFIKCGRPVLAYSIPAFKEVVVDKVGKLFSVGDVSEMASFALKLFTNIRILKILSRNAKVYSARFSCERMLNRYIELYKGMGGCL